jgi:hypothetical protein
VGGVALLEVAVVLVGWDIRGRGVRVGGKGMTVSFSSSREIFFLFSLSFCSAMWMLIKCGDTQVYLISRKKRLLRSVERRSISLRRLFRV